MYSYKELSELAGYADRVFNMINVMNELAENRFVKPLSTSGQEFAVDRISGVTKYDQNCTYFHLFMNLGIAFKNVPIVTPFGDSVLVRSLDFSIRKGDHLMITGPNGSGKTAILRILAGLWPLFCGEITRPLESLNAILYVPQRPYLSIGTLRDQIIYPHTKKEMESAGLSDADLWPILNLVFLDYIPDREGGFDAKKEWKDVFSGWFSLFI